MLYIADVCLWFHEHGEKWAKIYLGINMCYVGEGDVNGEVGCERKEPSKKTEKKDHINKDNSI